MVMSLRKGPPVAVWPSMLKISGTTDREGDGALFSCLQREREIKVAQIRESSACLHGHCIGNWEIRDLGGP